MVTLREPIESLSVMLGLFLMTFF